MVEMKIGGTPGMPTTILGASCAPAEESACSSAPAAITVAATPSLRTLPLPIIMSSLSRFGFCASSFEMKFGLLRLAHQRAPDLLAQFGEVRLAQGFARARPWQVDGDRFLNAARASLEHKHPIAHQHRLFDRMGHEHHGGRTLLPDPQQLELQDFACLRIDCGEGLVHQ